MIKLLNDLPDNVIGFEFAGEVTADDCRHTRMQLLVSGSGNDWRLAAGHLRPPSGPEIDESPE